MAAYIAAIATASQPRNRWLSSTVPATFGKAPRPSWWLAPCIICVMAEVMMRLGGGKRGEIVRDQLDQVKAVVRHDFAASCRHVQHIAAGDAVPKQAVSRERAEWVSLVDAVIALVQSCKSLQELEAKIAEQSRSLRNPPEHAMALSTIHSAKGLEWDVVFLAGLEDGVLPHVNSDDIEEERRIAYAGITRAKRLLGLTYSAECYGERSKPSPFLFELTGKEERLHI